MSPRTTAALAALTLTVPLGLAGTAMAGDQGKGDDRPQTAPGQVKQDKEPASPQRPAGEAKGHDKEPAKSKAAEPKSSAPKAAKPQRPAPKAAKPKTGSRQAPAQAKAGKTTICHATGSESNPYVQITISDNALKAHRAHQDGRDIVPAPAEGCPKGKQKQETKPAETPKDHGKVTICHATGSETNPYVRITISESALDAHRNHQDGRDIIPAPEGDCPGAGGVKTETQPGAPARVEAMGQVQAAPQGSAPAAAQPQGAVLGESVTGTAPGTEASRPEAPAGGVAGETERREAGADAAAATGRLPFTGADLVLLIAVGLGAVLAGVALHRSLGRSAA